MRRSVSVMLIILAISATLWATWFVVMPGSPAWVDPNVVGDDQVLVQNMMIGMPYQGGCAESVVGVGVRYEVLGYPEGFVWEVIEPNNGDPNQFVFEYTANQTGVYYARMKATVVEPYLAGETYYSLAFRVREAIFPNSVWWFQRR